MDIHELLDGLTLVDVRVIQREAGLKLGPDSGLAGLGDVEPAGELALDLNPVSWGEHLETWFRATLESDQFRIVAAVAVTYQRPADDAIPSAVRIEFLERIAVMTAYPYLRAEVQSLAADLHLGSVTLGILRPGQFRVSGSDTSREDMDQASNKAADDEVPI